MHGMQKKTEHKCYFRHLMMRIRLTHNYCKGSGLCFKEEILYGRGCGRQKSIHNRARK